MSANSDDITVGLVIAAPDDGTLGHGRTNPGQFAAGTVCFQPVSQQLRIGSLPNALSWLIQVGRLFFQETPRNSGG